MIQELITSQYHAQPVAIYSNVTHFTVGHFDEVSVRYNGDIDDSKLTRAWENGHEQKDIMDNKLQRDWQEMSNPDNPTIMSIRH